MPDLTLKPDENNPALVATHWAEATFVPVNGLNELGIPWIDLGLRPQDVDAAWFLAEVQRHGPSVTAFAEDATPGPGRAPDSPALSTDKRSWFVNVTQAGADAITLTVGIIKTDQR